jgi:hypothetical protein
VCLLDNCASVPQLRMQHEAMLEAIQAVLEVSRPQVVAVLSASYTAASLIRRALGVEKSNLMMNLIQKSKSEKSEKTEKKEKEKEQGGRSSMESAVYREAGRGGEDKDKEREMEKEKERELEREKEQERTVQSAADAFEALRAAVYALTVSLSEVCASLHCTDFSLYCTVLCCTVVHARCVHAPA